MWWYWCSWAKLEFDKTLTFLLFLFLFRWCFTQQAPSHKALLGSADHSLAHFSKPMLPCLHVGFEWERKRRQNFYVLELKSVFSSLGPVLVASVCTLHIRRKNKWVLCCENRMLMTWRRREVPYFTAYFPQKSVSFDFSIKLDSKIRTPVMLSMYCSKVVKA